jgi:hypothetical protein
MTKLHFYILGAMVVIAAVFAIFARSVHSVEWLEQVKLVSEDGNSLDRFGEAVAIDGDTAVVGAPTHYVPHRLGGGQGAAYIYTRSRDTWSLQAKLLIPENQANSYNFFGSRVAIDGNTILIAANPFDRADPSAPIYVFTRTGSIWSLQAQLALPNSQKFPISIFSYESVALDGDTAVAGTDRQAYVFRRHPATGTWLYEAELKATKQDSFFGAPVAINGNTIIIRGGDTNGTEAYVFVRDSNSGSWSQQAKLTPNARNTDFGAAIAISGNTVVVGAPREHLKKGSAYVFERDPATGTWSRRTKFVPPDVPMFFTYGFGASVAIDGNTIVVGASRQAIADILSLVWNKGGAYVFSRDSRTGRWSQQAKLLPKDYEQVAYSYGQRVSISGDQVIVAALSFTNAAYIFQRVDSQKPTN